MNTLLIAGAVVLMLDQWSKRAFESRSAVLPSLGSIVRIRRVSHVTSLYNNNSARAILALVWLGALLSAIALRNSGVAFQSESTVMGLGAALGGAGGNLVDILRSRHVVDFVDLGWWPVFNLADIAIIAGLVLAFWPS
jgi:signal peptidase II